MLLEETLQAPLACKARKAIIREAAEAFCKLSPSLPAPRSDSDTPEAPAAGGREGQGNSLVPPDTVPFSFGSGAPAEAAPAPATALTFAAALTAGPAFRFGPAPTPAAPAPAAPAAVAPLPAAAPAPKFTFADDDPDSTQVGGCRLTP
jgi:hypothetical protein